MSKCIAVINAGSSSIKFALYEVGSEALLFRGKVEQIGVSPHLQVADASGARVAERRWPAKGFDHRAATQEILETGRSLIEYEPVAAVGHRVVHGGTKYALPTRIDRSVIADLGELVPLAPLHQPHNLAPIEAIADAAPQVPQVACFDTAFHRSQPEIAQLFALPRELTKSGIRRYGFHGLSYEYVTSRLPEIAPELADARIVIAHLGNGASLCAVHGGRSVATTMGFTAVDGLVMGTRCGTIDPGVLLYLMDSHRMDARAVEKLIYRQSGLLGVSGISSDMRELRASSDPAAAEAIALFVYRIVREVGSLTAALGGVDALIFTGGIGENDAAIRAEVAKGCRWLGVELDKARNARCEGRISVDTSRISALVVPTDEERMIARQTSAVLGF
ncbi:MAG: acetate/propionate family kinase [Alphaproteobacteria bacterium]|jgi:acetate kinase